MFCSECGTQIPEGSVFCPGCGKRLTAARQSAQPAQAQEPATQPKKQNKKRNILLTVVIVVGVYLI